MMRNGHAKSRSGSVLSNLSNGTGNTSNGVLKNKVTLSTLNFAFCEYRLVHYLHDRSGHYLVAYRISQLFVFTDLYVYSDLCVY